MIEIKEGSIFDSKADVLVNPVNCVGVMGKGLAKEFKARYPTMFKVYKSLCDEGGLSPGRFHYWEDDNGENKLINFPTKYHWRDRSHLDLIAKGLDVLFDWRSVDVFNKLKVRSFAFPALGCGEGGLSWEEVEPVMIAALESVEFRIEIYKPFLPTIN